MDRGQLSLFGAEHTNELRIPRALKVCMKGARLQGSVKPVGEVTKSGFVTDFDYAEPFKQRVAGTPGGSEGLQEA